jgi:hypothetical protein
MEVNATYNTEDWVDAYLTIWKGMLKLTDQELEVTKLIALRHMELSQDIKGERLLAELLLSPTAKVHIRKALPTNGSPMSANNLQNYLTALKEKGVLTPFEDKFLLNHLLIPQTQLTFNFLVKEDAA